MTETITKHTEWGVQRPDGTTVRVAETGSQGDYDAHTLAATMNTQLERMGLGGHRGLRARVRRREVITTVATTVKAGPWETR